MEEVAGVLEGLEPRAPAVANCRQGAILGKKLPLSEAVDPRWSVCESRVTTAS